jgi:DNA-binding Xre family transcriptional regulator
MDIFANDLYKESITLRLKELQIHKKSLSLRKLANIVGIQYTYLSKVMNSKSIHLNEDDLYVLCMYLEFFPDEIDFILLQRSYETSAQGERKRILYNKIEKLKRERSLNADVKSVPSSSSIIKEMEYLFNPLCILIHVGLSSKKIRADTRQFCSKLGISAQQLKNILKILERNDLIRLSDDDPFLVTEVLQKRSHFSKEHPLTRVHQNLMKIELLQRLQHISESEKHSFLATFTMDQEGFKQIKDEFQLFLKKAEQISAKSLHDGVYQLSFDLFRWV